MNRIILISLVALFVKCQQERQTITLLNNLKISYSYRERQTQFVLTTTLGNKVSINNAWLGFGFNSVSQMVIL